MIVEAAEGVDAASEGVALAATGSVNVTYGAGWNMVSLPVLPASLALSDLFPGAISAFRFSGSYQQVTTLAGCDGYWLNLPAQNTYTLTGTAVNQCDRNWPLSWSMVGSPISGTAASAITQNPTGNIISIFRFAGSYQQVSLTTGSLTGGEGYWFNLTNAGNLVMNATSPAAKSIAGALPQDAALVGSRLVVSGSGSQQTVSLGVPAGEIVELPPLPPAGVLDVRANVGGIATMQVPVAAQPVDYRLQLQGSNLQVEWTIDPADANQWQLVVNGQAHPLSGLGSLSFAKTPESVALRYTPLPDHFALEANYPNPFNPSTTIQYVVAKAADVELTIYDVLGQTVRHLVNQQQMPGAYAVVWDGRNQQGNPVGNGLYFYELKAGDFHAMRKMLLTK